MKIVVQKFGGTSVSTKERRLLALEKILEAKKNGYSPVVVVSAMGRKGEAYATDTLLSLVDKSFRDNNLQASDLLMSCGEIISTVVISNELNKISIDAVPLLGGQAGIITDNNFSNASVVRIDTKKLLNILNEGRVPVVAGFQGLTEDGYITTLGRGGSDVTACLLGSALNSSKIEIYTDVDGIMTADPRIVKNASLIKEISYNEVFEFAHQGAKVIHPRAVEIAAKSNIPLVVKNTLNHCSGTVISKEISNKYNGLITGIANMDDRIQIKVSLEDNKSNKNYFNILNTLGENKISIDLINVFPDKKIFTINKNQFLSFSAVMKNLNIGYTYLDDCSKIALIGNGMKGVPGVMATILKILTKEGIEILQTADSNTTIWFLVKSDSATTAINALHHEFGLENEFSFIK
ncbi:aspartate kinase [Clostridium pasteurianum]|uniref:Aspartokinase n=1 Tax=Clostridium pasteurianum BC1 TaxID=86416 RepID=R4KGT4_CLOPA|nr:aspartate kinase [Clostridium pasteurianum]AGK98820.1 aspartate kinase [Clostridium pasteurianum BC1]